MHSQLETPRGFTLMMSDTPPHMMGDANVGRSVSISLSGGAGDESELRGYWDKLIAGGSVFAPLEKAPWGDQFGMCTDRFGVTWMVNIAAA
jgi:PhnB protein